MKFNRNPLSNAVKNGLSSALVLGLASSPLAVLAQDDADGEDGVELDRVQVTGSRIKRTDVEGALPVTVIDRDMIELSGESSAADMLRNLTFNTTGLIASAIRQLCTECVPGCASWYWLFSFSGSD